MKTRLLIAFLIIPMCSSLAMAQDIGIVVEDQQALTGGRFFGTLICGVLLALAFNLVLTNLAVATGISIASPEDKLRPGASSGKKESGSSGGSAIKKVNNLFGLWTMVATSICLFIASWLAIEISGALTVLAAIVVALAVWAAFYLVMTALEATVLTTVVGTLFSTAASAFRSTAHGMKSIFEKSPESRAADTAADITASVRDEIFGDLNTPKMKKQLQSYIEQLSPPSARDIKKELIDLLEKTELNAVVDDTGYPMDVEHVIARFEEESPNKERARSLGNQVREAINSFKQQRKSGKDAISAGIDSAMEMGGQSEEEARHQREEIETYLRNSNKHELQPEELKHRVEMIFRNPKEGLKQIGQSVRAIDHDTAVGILEQRKDMSHQEAEDVAHHFEQAMHSILTMGTSLQGKATGQSNQMKANIESKLRNYLDSLEEPELDYDAIREDVTLLFHDPKAGADALITRLQNMDRDTIKSILESRRDISPERAEKIVSKIEEARDDVVQKANKMKSTVEEKVNQTRKMAADTAEETRENAAIAAWWACGTAVVSGVFAALGGYLAIVV